MQRCQVYFPAWDTFLRHNYREPSRESMAVGDDGKIRLKLNPDGNTTLHTLLSFCILELYLMQHASEKQKSSRQADSEENRFYEIGDLLLTCVLLSGA